MSFFAPRLARVLPSPTLEMTRLALEMKAAGHDVIGLSAGEPDFDTPDFIKQAAIEGLRRGATKYTAVDGTPSLKKAIAAKFARENGLTYTPQEISVGAGGKQVIFNALVATVGPGDEVVIPTPYWVSYPDMVRLAEGEPVFCPTAPERGFKMRPEDLDRVLSPRTKWLILNAPSNPSGVTYTADELRAFADVLRKYPDVWVLSDDIYEHILYTDAPFSTLAQVAPDLKDRVLTVNGVSKAYAMTGWRIGYAGGPAALIKKMGEIQGHSTSNPATVSQVAAEAALTGPQDFLIQQRAAFRERRDSLVAGLNAIPGLRCPLPEGAFYVFPSCAGLIGTQTADGATLDSDTAVVKYLLTEALVATVPGSGFGLGPHVRLSYAVSGDVLRKACARIHAAVDKLKGVRTDV